MAPGGFRKCTVVGCSNQHRGLFTLPSEQENRTLWINFIVNGPMLATLPKRVFVCGHHFTSDCFENEGAFNAGFASQLRVKKGSVPTIRDPLATSPTTSKRNDVACQTEVPLRSVGTQLSRRTLEPHMRSKSTQTTVLTRDIGVGTARASRQALQESTTMNRPSKRQRLDWEEDDNPLEGSGSELAANKYNRRGPEADLEKAPHDSPIISNHQCLQCEDRNQWKSQVNGSVPATSDKQLTDDTNLAAQAASTNNNHGIITDVPEIVAVIDEERDDVDETDESVDEDDMDSDEDWDLMDAVELYGEYSEESDYENSDLRRNQLCPDCGVFCRKLWRHTCEYKIKPYSCNLCGKRCVSESALSFHDKIHSEDYKHQCKYCNVTFKSKRDKILHEMIHVNDRKPYKCCDCSETFSTHKGRRIHQNTHRRCKLTCDICGTEFVRTSALQRHTLVHTGEKPYKCSVCQQSFKQSNHLTSHMRLHTGERPYKCQHCDKCFNHNLSLKSHVQRYHPSTSGHDQKKPDHRASHSGDTQEDDGKDADSEPDNGDEELDTEEEQQQEVVVRRIYTPKKRSTGRPIGRPKRFASSNVVHAVQIEGTGTDSENEKIQMQKTKNKQCISEENEHSDGNRASRSAPEEENTATPAERLDSGSDFGPEDTIKQDTATRTVVNSQGSAAED